MNKYPLDEKGIENLTFDLRQHDIAQREIISKLSTLVLYAHDTDPDHSLLGKDWHSDASILCDDLYKRNIEFENLRFDQSNGHKVDEVSPFWGQLESEELNSSGETTEEELAAHFKIPVPRKMSEKAVDTMSLEEIESWEKKQDNSNDIYKISARVKNIAREGGASLTDMGEMLCNTYVHVMKAFYNFAENLQDKEIKIKLTELIRNNENMPGNLIAAINANVKVKKDE